MSKESRKRFLSCQAPAPHLIRNKRERNSHTWEWQKKTRVRLVGHSPVGQASSLSAHRLEAGATKTTTRAKNPGPFPDWARKEKIGSVKKSGSP
jgi:hypothetical protein